ncbi:MFS transporter [Skermanella aerolata]|uniref:MFS transporter n=1 Tax=Skermanella aerolata TaxID=393310 RepID=UPI000A004876|nr:MFS transporter [Skermanella aerolata]
MSVNDSVSTSTQLERDARLVSTDHKVAPEEIALGVVIGRSAEFFDFFVYGIGSVLVFPHVFFPFVDPLTGTLYSFMVFSLAFIARPIGSMIFMTVDRLYGRGVKLTAAMLLLGFSTAVISFLPGYEQIGAASIFLLGVCRVSQGLALGGAWDGLASLLSLNAPRNRRGWYAMMPQLGAPFGFLLANGLFAYFVINLSEEDFLSWGWRFPFYVAFTINVVALFARLRLVVTDEFVKQLETRELEPTSVADMFAAQGKFVLIGAFVPLASFALFHLVTIFPLSWVTLFSDRSAGSFLLVQCAGAVVGAVAIVLSGLIADRIGRRPLLAISAGLIALFSAVTPFLLGGNSFGQTAFIVLGFGLLGLSFGQAAGAVSSNFASQYRYTGAALSSDLSWLTGAGFAPLVALGLSSNFGLGWVSVYLLSGAVCTLAALLFNKLEIHEGSSKPPAPVAGSGSRAGAPVHR